MKIALITSLMIGWAAACIKHNANPVMAASPDTTATVIQPPLPKDSLTYLALGDSYTIGQSVPVRERYPTQVVTLLRADNMPYNDPDIIAVTGWTTADLLAALPDTAPSSPYHIVSLLIGVNNQYLGLGQSLYRDQFTVLLQRSIRMAGNRPSHVIVLSIPDYSVTPFARGRNRATIAAEIDSFNVINREISLAYQVRYIDVTGESRKAASDPSLIAGDSLHFSGKEYAIWAAMMRPLMASIH
ncbi:SGNH/GDSL hydrolase family protein [Flavitalea sp. BT771]|uniref:SGNH/GDSL hydrolase family protein n=1 Tax=Flavitalea sp. BT771 TaxID=3063329 RepID=UPI0026E1752E|nr:SGNH/GDSL hydrolase family protein [Flavitalea sp. BT771]MDO6431210.1 SGNH/GDSL hydrolase family protein [Flavitalea sp. BT771]MDV6220117.1 SGNH/GDSL hydrolase family protein [Flavitalea sp. BT771]